MEEKNKKDNLRISLVQAHLVWENPEKNFDNFDKELSPLQGKTDLIILPEMFNTGFSVHPSDIAESMDGPSVNYLKKKSVELNAAIIASIIIEEEAKYYNRLIYATPDGVIEYYDKKHLFRMGGEHHRFEAGTDTLVVKCKGWKIMPLICYDLRFPVWARNYYKEEQYKYDLLVYIANWPAPRSTPWKTLLQARAIENQCFVAGVNRVGEDGNNLQYSGDSALIDAKGNVISSIKPHEVKIETIVVRLEELTDFRKKFHLGLDWDSFTIEN
ncbi:MAG: amidohydrolase [Bacteroidales bacterium]